MATMPFVQHVQFVDVDRRTAVIDDLYPYERFIAHVGVPRQFDLLIDATERDVIVGAGVRWLMGERERVRLSARIAISDERADLCRIAVLLCENVNV